MAEVEQPEVTAQQGTMSEGVAPPAETASETVAPVWQEESQKKAQKRKGIEGKSKERKN